MSRLSEESSKRLVDKLKKDLGFEIMEALRNPEVQEIMLNADGSLIFNTPTGSVFQRMLPESKGYEIIYSIAGLNGKVVKESNPSLECSLPLGDIFKGERFRGSIPPMSQGPSFNLRKKPLKIWTLDDYEATGRMSIDEVSLLKSLINAHKNIVVCGAPNCGKSTVTNALIDEMVKQNPNERLIILEDTQELQCRGLNKEFFLTCKGMNMQDLLRQTMRASPERILVGEVRGAEALDLLKAWNTGCPGGIATIHANGTEEALQRLGDCAMEAGLIHPPLSLIDHTVDVVVFVTAKEGHKGFIGSINIRGEK
jgi:type IV secretion system protein TrbB